MKNILNVLNILLLSLVISCTSQKNSLKFNIEKYKTQALSYGGKEFKVRAYESVIYVKNPVDTAYQVMNIYIPEAYFSGGSINGYTAKTAPIFYPNQVGGYMPAFPASTSGKKFAPPVNGGIEIKNNDAQTKSKVQDIPMTKRDEENIVIVALSRGYVVASAGARGRTNQDTNGKYFGKAPAGLVDLKASVRYLKFNDELMPGDANKIIANGTSAGGAMSALLGATGDHPDYLPYLEEIGAAQASDAIFASSNYCPITNLDNADMAYEWQFYGINSYKKSGPFGPSANAETLTLSENQIQVSTDLKNQFPQYLNSLNLKDENNKVLTLEANGEGSFKEFIKAQIITSANKALQNGKDLSIHTWLTISEGKVIHLDWQGYLNYLERQKSPPAFDALDLSSAENIEFGTKDINAQHFTTYSTQHSTMKNATRADAKIVKMMNPMYYIGNPESKTASYWRIRHGSKDKDTGLAVSAILTLKLRNNGHKVDYSLPWDVRHSGDYDLPELFEWIDCIAK